jgi:hypothetical protein
MKFDMTQPCADCPFRYDIQGYLREERAAEIAEALLNDASFTCHKTNSFIEDDDGNSETVETDDSQHCADALIFLERQDRPNQIMRWMERIRLYDRRKLNMEAPVFDEAETFIEHHAFATERS